MSRLGVTVLSVTLLGIGAGGGAILVRSPDDSGADSSVRAADSRTAGDDVSGELAALRRVVRSLEVRLESSERAKAAEAKSAVGGSLLPDEEETLERESPIERPPAKGPVGWSQEQEAQFFADYFQMLEAQRLSEPRDAQIEKRVRRAVETMWQEQLAATGEESRLVKVECGATICTVETRHPDRLAQEQHAQRLHPSVGEFLPHMSLYKDPSGERVVAYFAREGAQLPRPPEAFD